MDATNLTDGTAAVAIRTIGALLLVLALIIVTAWAARRMRSLRAGGGRWFTVRAAHALGPRERVMLVEAAGAHLLLSVGSGGVRLLHHYNEAPVLPEAAAPLGGSFAERLAQLRRSPE